MSRGEIERGEVSQRSTESNVIAAALDVQPSRLVALGDNYAVDSQRLLGSSDRCWEPPSFPGSFKEWGGKRAAEPG